MATPLSTAQNWVDARPRLHHVADVDGDGVVDMPAVAQALAEAADEMALYLASRYPTYPNEARAALAVYELDIATYRMASTNEALTEAITARYDSVLDYLRAVAKGALDLPGTASPGGAGAQSGASNVRVDGPERVFTRDTMAGW